MATKERRQELREKHSDSWIAVDEGDRLVGEVLDATEAWSDARTNNGKNPERGWYPLLTIGNITEATGYPDDTNELKWHCFGAVAYNEVMRHRPNVGETVTITYAGQGKAKGSMNPPEIYRLRVAGRTDQAKQAYDRIEKQAGNEPSTAGGPVTSPELAADEAAEDIPF